MIPIALDDIRYAENAPPIEGSIPLVSIPLLILVGMTGAGKTTTVGALARRGGEFSLLPERRQLAEELIIPAMLTEEGGQPRQPDRLQRMALTRRFRERHPGGFAHLLAHIALLLPPPAPWCLFDGLRGPEEIGHALTHLPRAGLVILDVPDPLRLRRLLSRGDAFDAIRAPGTSPAPASSTDDAVFEDGMPFTPDERRELLAAVPAGFAAAEVRDKLRIIVEERRNYDKVELSALAPAHPERVLTLEPARLNPDEIADNILGWWLPLQSVFRGARGTCSP